MSAREERAIPADYALSARGDFILHASATRLRTLCRGLTLPSFFDRDAVENEDEKERSIE